MAKETGRSEVSVLKERLGEATYRMGKQQKVVNDETIKLRKLQQEINDIATEIEKLDGKRDMA